MRIKARLGDLFTIERSAAIAIPSRVVLPKEGPLYVMTPLHCGEYMITAQCVSASDALRIAGDGDVVVDGEGRVIERQH